MDWREEMARNAARRAERLAWFDRIVAVILAAVIVTVAWRLLW